MQPWQKNRAVIVNTKMKQVKNAFTTLVDKTKVTLAIPTIVKTVDGRYTRAKILFQSLSAETSEVIGSIMQMEQRLQKISQQSVRIAENMDSWFADAPEESQLKAKTALSFARNFEAFTTSFLGPRIEPHVIVSLAKWEQNLIRIRNVKELRKTARKKYDRQRAKLMVLLENPGGSDATLRACEAKTNSYRVTYEKYNEDFIGSVEILPLMKQETLDAALSNMAAIMSQYMMFVFTDLQKFRTTFSDTEFIQEHHGVPGSPSPMVQNPYLELGDPLAEPAGAARDTLSE